MENAEAIHVQPNSGTTMGPAAACRFSGCIMPAMASPGQGPERLDAQLLVDSIPALIRRRFCGSRTFGLLSTAVAARPTTSLKSSLRRRAIKTF
jgi:hypothetical protein